MTVGGHQVATPCAAVRRYPVVGRFGAGRVWVLAALPAAGAFALDAWFLGVVITVGGGVAYHLWRSVVIEVSPAGLTRGLVLSDTFSGRTTVLAWRAIAEVRTDWCRANDDSSLETTVRARDGAAIRFSTAMGVGAYWACLADVVRHAPEATRSGLTDATLADGPPTARDVVASAATVALLAVVLVAFAGLHYVLATGRSSLSRYLEATGAAFSPAREACDGAAWPGSSRPGQPPEARCR